MIISQMYNGIATGNVEEGAKFFTEKLGYTIKHRLMTSCCKIYIMENQYNEFDKFLDGTKSIPTIKAALGLCTR